MAWTNRVRVCEDCSAQFEATGSRMTRCRSCYAVYRRERHRVTGRRVCMDCGDKIWAGAVRCLACSGRAHRVNRTPLQDATQQPSELDIAWAAGFYEGEGTAGSLTGSFRIAIPQHNLEPLEMMQRWFGGRICTTTKVPVLVLCGPRAIRLAKTIYPYLSAKRRSQVDVALVGWDS